MAYGGQVAQDKPRLFGLLGFFTTAFLRGAICAAAFFAGFGWAAHFYFGAGLQTVLAVHYYLFAFFEAFVNQGLAVFDLSDFDGLEFDGLIGADDEGVGTLGAALDDGGGDDEAVGAGGEEEADVDELAGPEVLFFVGEGGFEFDGGGGGVYLVVNDGKLAFAQGGFVVAVDGQDFDFALGHFGEDFGGLLFGQGEDDGDGAELGDDDEAVGIAGVNDVALVHEADAGASVNRCGDGGVVQLHLGAVHGGLVGFDGGGELVHEGFLGVVGLGGNDFFGDKLGVAFEVGLGVGQLGVVLGFFSFGLRHGGLERGGIYLGEEIAGVNFLAFGEGDFLQLAIHADSHGDAVVGLDGAEAVEVDGDVFAEDFSGGDGDGQVFGRAGVFFDDGGLTMADEPDGGGDAQGQDYDQDNGSRFVSRRRRRGRLNRLGRAFFMSWHRLNSISTAPSLGTQTNPRGLWMIGQQMGCPDSSIMAIPMDGDYVKWCFG